MITQEQADQLYLEERAINMRNANEARIINWIQGAVAILMLALIIRNLFKTK